MVMATPARSANQDSCEAAKRSQISASFAPLRDIESDSRKGAKDAKTVAHNFRAFAPSRRPTLALRAGHIGFVSIAPFGSSDVENRVRQRVSTSLDTNGFRMCAHG
jgi:hypothetical protein